MSRPRLPLTEKLSEQVNFVCTKAQRRMIEQAAKKAQLTVSEWARVRLMRRAEAEAS